MSDLDMGRPWAMAPGIEPFNWPAGWTSAGAVEQGVVEGGEILVPVNLLRSLADPDDCELDHHGGCQAHGYLELELGEKCPQRELRDLLAERAE